MPRAILRPTEEQRGQVKLLAAVGIDLHNIARWFHVSEKTLLKYYREELFRGPMEANAKVGKTLLEMATNGNSPVATLFYLRTRAGYRENQSSDGRRVAMPDFIVASEKRAA